MEFHTAADWQALDRVLQTQAIVYLAKQTGNCHAGKSGFFVSEFLPCMDALFEASR